MMRRIVVCLALGGAASAAAATSGFLLGLDYSEQPLASATSRRFQAAGR